MERILCFGSINIDHVYEVDSFVQPGETISCKTHTICPGGKGFNQAIALARAGCPVWFSGKHGADAEFMIDMLKKENINTSLIRTSGGGSGHTVIQVDATGQNCIIVCAGANGEISKEDIDDTLSHFQPGDYLLLQNEISNLPYIIRKSVACGLLVYLNPSPISEELLDSRTLQGIKGLILNEVEGEALTGTAIPEQIISELRKKYPTTEIILTLGDKGVMYSSLEQTLSCSAVKTTVVDTTAAGDTFTGYFLAGMMNKEPMEEILHNSCKAASIAVSRLGAAVSVPYRHEVDCTTVVSTI